MARNGPVMCYICAVMCYIRVISGGPVMPGLYGAPGYPGSPCPRGAPGAPHPTRPRVLPVTRQGARRPREPRRPAPICVLHVTRGQEEGAQAPPLLGNRTTKANKEPHRPPDVKLQSYIYSIPLSDFYVKHSAHSWGAVLRACWRIICITISEMCVRFCVRGPLYIY